MKNFTLQSSCSILENGTSISQQDLAKVIDRKVLAQVVPNENGYSEITIYSTTHRTLSENLPILTNLGFMIDSEVSYKMNDKDVVVFAQKYFIKCDECKMIKDSKDYIEATLEATIYGEIQNSPLNSLSFHISIPPVSIEIIRAISNYEQQLIPSLNAGLICQTLIKHSQITKLFLNYFENKFDPDIKNRAHSIKSIQEDIESKIKNVENINEDKVLNIFYKILQSITRTNYYCCKSSVFKDRAFAIKIDVYNLLSYIKGVQPRIEAYVYHSLFHGVHLRRKNVARGGIRWSDRHDDFRSEVRLLMQAQRQKNSIIIPTGAKGGFVIFKDKPSKDEFEKVYRLYINALLDLVDNRSEDGAIFRDENMIIYDSDDTYFVVAADKGTSAMSDTANSISKDRGFWLKDAFASGDSRGFSHKEMGITAKGAIKSVERFFIEQKKNFYEDITTVIGIGSPAGDVFGNGMILSSKFALIAAVSSREIFIDPRPEVESAFLERKRLFQSGLGWSSYSSKLISKGGGIFKKSSKDIKVSPEMQRLFGIKKDIVNGEELTRYILTSKADMLFNGGVGTYVRSSDENDSEIGDKPNESVRVVAKDIKASCVCEGGNLGFTQNARIEYAKKGGRISADSIDNSAGVQTSDYEVNLKIVINNLISKGVISSEDKYEVMHSLESEVEKIVIWTNYHQSLALSLDEIRSQKDIERFKNSISIMEERIDSFKRDSVDIPPVDDFSRAIGKNGAILRPILSVMLSFAKIFLKSVLLKNSEFLNSEFCIRYLLKYFPKKFTTLYQRDVLAHPLKEDIIATYISNKIINAQGASFVSDFDDLGEEKFIKKIRAFLVVNELIYGGDIRHEIYREDYALNVKKQYELLLELEESVEFLVNWVLEHDLNMLVIYEHYGEYQKSLKEFVDGIDSKYIKSITPNNEILNRYFSMIDYIKMAFTIISVKEQTNQSFCDVANLFFTLTQDLQMLNLIDMLSNTPQSTIWDERLCEDLRISVFEIIYSIVKKIMEFKRKNETIKEAYVQFTKINTENYRRYLRDIETLKQSQNINLINLSVVVSSLKKIVISID